MFPKFTKYKYKEGDVFNKLTVIKYLYHNENKKSIWLFKCYCGNETELQMDNVKNGHTKSCGCYVCTDKRKTEGSAFRKLLLWYTGRASKKNLEFKLTEEQFKDLTSKNCHYCNLKPEQKVYNKTKVDSYIYNGIDRIDNEKGYLIDNVVPCCGQCNKMKRDMSYIDFTNKIYKMYHNLKLTSLFEE